jgi:hypothetical protein
MRRLLAVVALAGLLTGCGTAFTPARLGPSFAEVFTGLYAAQQRELGRIPPSPQGLRPLASCRRTGTVANGPGEDWVCTVDYVDADQSVTQSFEVQVKPDGCWKADGPPANQPAQLVDALTGDPRTNPLAEFDGCLDTSW